MVNIMLPSRSVWENLLYSSELFMWEINFTVQHNLFCLVWSLPPMFAFAVHVIICLSYVSVDHKVDT